MRWHRSHRRKSGEDGRILGTLPGFHRARPCGTCKSRPASVPLTAGRYAPPPQGDRLAGRTPRQCHRPRPDRALHAVLDLEEPHTPRRRGGGEERRRAEHARTPGQVIGDGSGHPVTPHTLASGPPAPAAAGSRPRRWLAAGFAPAAGTRLSTATGPQHCPKPAGPSAAWCRCCAGSAPASRPAVPPAATRMTARARTAGPMPGHASRHPRHAGQHHGNGHADRKPAAALAPARLLNQGLRPRPGVGTQPGGAILTAAPPTPAR